jgi:hypothetical protein
MSGHYIPFETNCAVADGRFRQLQAHPGESPATAIFPARLRLLGI